jgi:hypothetical protein
MKRSRIVVLLVLAVIAALPAAAVKYVDKNNPNCNDFGPGSEPAPFCTIQGGWNLAAAGELVRVKPGTYNECVFAFDTVNPKNVEIVADAWLQNPPNNTVTIIDATGAPNCTFSGGGPASAVNIAGEGPTGSKFQGFTVHNATNTGIFGVGSVVITNNVVSDNSSFGWGGGIYVYTANCYYGDTTTTIADNNVHDNAAEDGGGGIAVTAGYQAIVQSEDCTFDGDATVTIANNTVAANTTPGSGGGINVTAFANDARTHSVVITQNTVNGNSAGSDTTIAYGGGIYGLVYGYGSESIDITSNTVAGNSAVDRGGGVSVSSFPAIVASSVDHHLTIEDNTITGNTGQRGGGGIDLLGSAFNLNGTQTIAVEARRNTVTGNLVTKDNGLAEQVVTFKGGGGISAVLESITSTSPNLGMLVEENRFSGNSSKMVGGGAALHVIANGDFEGAIAPSSATLTFRRNRVTQNSVDSSVIDAVGGGVFAYLDASGESTATMRLDLNTVASNTLDNGNEAGGIHAESFTTQDSLGQHDGLAVLRVTNTIVANNQGVGVGGPTPGAAGVFSPGGNAEFDVSGMNYNDVFGHTGGNLDTWFTAGTGTIFGDPRLDTSFIPQDCSPTIDAADPALPVGNEPQPNGNRVNMGHTGGTSLATRGLADINGDGEVDGIDVVRLSVAFGSSTGQPRFDGAVDFDSDTQIDGDDLAILAGDFGVVCP